MNKMILFAMSFLCAVATAKSQQDGTQIVNAESVPIEEYVPKVIIEGKWGTGSGEFGAIADPMQSDQYGAPQYPGSLAVNSRGEIYVLDHVNGRIQKFSKDGKYLTSLNIPGCADENGKSVIEKEKGEMGGVSFELRRKPVMVGINIVIDSKDTLYYYLKRTKDGKETGEVWEFREDKLIKKYSSAQKGGLPAKFKLTPVGYNQFALTVAEPATTPAVHKYHVNVKKEGENSQIFVEDNAKKIISRIEVLATAEYAAAKAKHGRAKSDVYFEKMLDNGNFQVRTVNGGLENISTEEREYTPEGKLVRRIKSPPGYSHGIDVGENGIKVIRWGIQKSN